jgi:lia operon protein LiaG
MLTSVFRPSPARALARPLVLPLMMLGLAAPPLAGAQTERFNVGGDQVAVYNLAGKMRVEGGTGSEVVVDVTRGGADAKALRIEHGRIGSDETLRVIYPDDDIIYPDLGSRTRTDVSVRDDGTFFGRMGALRGHRVTIRDHGSGTEAYADLVIRVPAGKRISLYLAVGTLDVMNVDGDIRVDVSAARVMTKQTKGRLDLDTGSGRVEVSDAQGDVSLDTGSGGVTLARIKGPSLLLDAGSGGVSGTDLDVERLDLDVGSGGTELARVRAQDIKIDAGSGHTDIGIVSDVRSLDVDTGSGGVTLRIPESLGAEVDIDTGSGGIDTDFPIQVTRRSRTHLTGTIGDGKGRIRIDTGSGGVRLKRS